MSRERQDALYAEACAARDASMQRLARACEAVAQNLTNVIDFGGNAIGSSRSVLLRLTSAF